MWRRMRGTGAVGTGGWLFKANEHTYGKTFSKHETEERRTRWKERAGLLDYLPGGVQNSGELGWPCAR